jgi:WhiB family redox-sensing transcriptional regulator
MVQELIEDGVRSPAGRRLGLLADWRMQAACRPYDSEMFFPVRSPNRNKDTAKAKAVCDKCPVREECLQAAMDGREKIGIWGGLTPEERARLHRRGRRAASVVTASPAVTPAPVDAATPLPDETAAACDGERRGYPTREQIRRGVAAGWLRLDAFTAAVGESRQA